MVVNSVTRLLQISYLAIGSSNFRVARFSTTLHIPDICKHWRLDNPEVRASLRCRIRLGLNTFLTDFQIANAANTGNELLGWEFTIFAPKDKAVKNTLEGAAMKSKDLFGDVNRLPGIVLYHLVPSPLRT